MTMMSVDSSAIFPWAIMRVVLPMGGATAVGGACVCVCVRAKVRCYGKTVYTMRVIRVHTVAKFSRKQTLFKIST